MAWIYKNHYGRTIINELVVNRNHVYDEEWHKYREKTELEKEIEKAKIDDKLKDLLDLEERKRNVQEVLKTKEKIKSAKKIQNWWRNILYNPENGILFLRSQSDFYSKSR
jgi:hypothetical protein